MTLSVWSSPYAVCATRPPMLFFPTEFPSSKISHLTSCKLAAGLHSDHFSTRAHPNFFLRWGDVCKKIDKRLRCVLVLVYSIDLVLLAHRTKVWIEHSVYDINQTQIAQLWVCMESLEQSFFHNPSFTRKFLQDLCQNWNSLAQWWTTIRMFPRKEDELWEDEPQHSAIYL